MTVDFRDAGSGDASSLSALGRATFIETFGHLYKPEDLAAFLANHSEEAWQEQLAASEIAVRIGEEAGQPVAYAKVGPVSLPVAIKRPAIELRQLYVLKPWQGQGVATPLMAWVLAEARRRGAQDIYLSVWTENYRARRFYERYGFSYVAPYAFMVGNQADADEIFRLDLEAAG
jgi:GNAT superfamily N-acetyltransferase